MKGKIVTVALIFLLVSLAYFFGSVYAQNPDSVSLGYPANRQLILNGTGTLAFTYSFNFSEPVVNASLWINTTGTWALNQWNSSALNSTGSNSFIISLPNVGTYVWNVEVFNATVGLFAVSNDTFIVYVSSGGVHPLVSYNTPAIVQGPFNNTVTGVGWFGVSLANTPTSGDELILVSGGSDSNGASGLIGNITETGATWKRATFYYYGGHWDLATDVWYANVTSGSFGTGIICNFTLSSVTARIEVAEWSGINQTNALDTTGGTYTQDTTNMTTGAETTTTCTNDLLVGGTWEHTEAVATMTTPNNGFTLLDGKDNSSCDSGYDCLAYVYENLVTTKSLGCYDTGTYTTYATETGAIGAFRASVSSGTTWGPYTFNAIVSISASASKLHTASRSGSLRVSISSSVSRLVTYLRTSNSLTVSVSMVASKLRTVPKSVSLSVNISAVASRVASYVRSGTLTDTISMAASRVATYLRTASLSASISAVASKLHSVAESVALTVKIQTAISDLPTHIRSSSVSVSVSASVSRLISYVRSGSLVASVSSSVSRLASYVRSGSLTASIVASVSRLVSYARSGSLSASIVSAISDVLLHIRSSSVTVSVSTSVSRLASYVRSGSLTVSFMASASKLASYLRSGSVAVSVLTVGSGGKVGHQLVTWLASVTVSIVATASLGSNIVAGFFGIMILLAAMFLFGFLCYWHFFQRKKRKPHSLSVETEKVYLTE